MISELDRQHGAALRQLIVECGAAATIQSIDDLGRIDTFLFNGNPFHIRHSGKRLTPWQFTLLPESLRWLKEVHSRFGNGWLILVCGIDGIVGVSIEEASLLIDLESDRPEWLRVSRSRNSMYRLVGSKGELGRAVPKGMARFIQACVGAVQVEGGLCVGN